MSITLTLEPQEVESILADVGEKPIKDRIGLWLKIRDQAVAAIQAQQPSAESPNKPVDSA